MKRFSGSRVFISGGARGIGLAIAQAFASEGATVTAADIDISSEEFEKLVPHGQLLSLDVSNESNVARHFMEAKHSYDVVIANAGISGPEGPIFELEADDWNTVFSINVHGVFHVLKHSSKRMVQDRRPGGILVTASIAGLTAEANHAAYASSKWAIIGLLKSAAIELAPYNIRVNGVCPGDVRTQLYSGMLDEDQYHGPMGRLAEPNEVAAAYIWLASEEARFVSGETIVVDGGLINSALVH